MERKDMRKSIKFNPDQLTGNVGEDGDELPNYFFERPQDALRNSRSMMRDGCPECGKKKHCRSNPCSLNKNYKPKDKDAAAKDTSKAT